MYSFYKKSVIRIFELETKSMQNCFSAYVAWIKQILMVSEMWNKLNLAMLVKISLLKQTVKRLRYRVAITLGKLMTYSLFWNSYSKFLLVLLLNIDLHRLGNILQQDQNKYILILWERLIHQRNKATGLYRSSNSSNESGRGSFARYNDICSAAVLPSENLSGYFQRLYARKTASVNIFSSISDAWSFLSDEYNIYYLIHDCAFEQYFS